MDSFSLRPESPMTFDEGATRRGAVRPPAGVGFAAGDAALSGARVSFASASTSASAFCRQFARRSRRDLNLYVRPSAAPVPWRRS